MPDSFGKRQRRNVKARKAAAREERRVARSQRRKDRAARGVRGPTGIDAPATDEQFGEARALPDDLEPERPEAEPDENA